MFEIAKPGAAPLFLDRDAEEAKFAHFRQQVARKRIRAVNLCGARGDFVLGETCHGLADHVRSFTEIEVQSGICVRDHAADLARLPPAVSLIFLRQHAVQIVDRDE